MLITEILLKFHIHVKEIVNFVMDKEDQILNNAIHVLEEVLLKDQFNWGQECFNN